MNKLNKAKKTWHPPRVLQMDFGSTNNKSVMNSVEHGDHDNKCQIGFTPGHTKFCLSYTTAGSIFLLTKISDTAMVSLHVVVDSGPS